MMLVIRSRGGGSCDSGMGRYCGSGMLDAVGRQLFSSEFKRAISIGVNSALARKVVDALLNGATSTSQKVGKVVGKGATSAGQKAVESVVNNAIDSTKKWIVGKKRSLADPIIVPQKRKLDIDSLIDVLFSISSSSSSSSSMDSILYFQEKYIESDAIKSYEYNEYQPTSGSNLNIPGNIHIHIENQDEFYHPRRSYLLVVGNLLKEDGTRYAAADVIVLANNGVMHLFSNVKYESAGQEIESANNPGIAGVLMDIAKYPYDYAYGTGMIQHIGWCVGGKSFRETEGVYHREIRPPRLVQFCNRVGESVWFLRKL